VQYTYGRWTLILFHSTLGKQMRVVVLWHFFVYSLFLIDSGHPLWSVFTIRTKACEHLTYRRMELTESLQEFFPLQDGHNQDQSLIVKSRDLSDTRKSGLIGMALICIMEYRRVRRSYEYTIENENENEDEKREREYEIKYEYVPPLCDSPGPSISCICIPCHIPCQSVELSRYMRSTGYIYMYIRISSSISSRPRNIIIDSILVKDPLRQARLPTYLP
jgi:hypothetical protein